MKKILVPIDLTENANRVLMAAKLLADKNSTELLILYAYMPYIPDMTVPSGAGMIPMDPVIEKNLQDRLEKHVTTLAGEGFQAKSLWSVGGVDSAIFEAIDQQKPDLVVLGRTGTGGFLDSLLGSSATHIGLDAHCPVLIIPPQATPRKFDEIVYATQLEYDENEILGRAFPVFKRMGARLTFVKVNSSSQPNVQSDQQYIEQIREEFSVPESVFVFREAGSVLQGVEDYCDEIQADLLVMSTRTRGFIEAFITNPSITKKMILHTHIPLLVYHLKED